MDVPLAVWKDEVIYTDVSFSPGLWVVMSLLSENRDGLHVLMCESRPDSETDTRFLTAFLAVGAVRVEGGVEKERGAGIRVDGMEIVRI